MITLKALAAASAIALLAALPAFAQQPGAPAVAAPPPLPYGAPISFEVAKKAMAAAEAEAMKNNLAEVIAILDSGGNLVMLHRMENAQFGSVRIAEGKARAAIECRRPSKAWEDAIAGGGAGVRVLSFGVTASEGGLPIVVDGKIIGAIGVSGAALSSQDGQVAKAGADAVK